MIRPRINDWEYQKQEKLKNEKPLAYAKMKKFDEKLARGESIAIIQYQYDYRCNFRCVHCSTEGQGGQTRRKMTPADAADLARQADEYGLARFVITGGEPLIFPDLDELIGAIDPSKFYINVDTNGWRLTGPKAVALKALGVDRIQLSIDSLDPKSHDAFRRVPGSHERAIAAVKHATDAGLDIFIQTVVDRNRLYSYEFKSFMEYFNVQGIGVFVTFAKPVGAWEGKVDGLIGAEDIKYFKELEKVYDVFNHLTSAYGREGRCISMWGMVSVTPYGDVLPCPYHYKPIGNLFDEPLKDILERGMKTPPYDQRIRTCWVADRQWKENK